MLDENELHERFPWTASLVFNTEMKKGGFSEKHVPSDSYLVGSKKTKGVPVEHRWVVGNEQGEILPAFLLCKLQAIESGKAFGPHGIRTDEEQRSRMYAMLRKGQHMGVLNGGCREAREARPKKKKQKAATNTAAAAAAVHASDAPGWCSHPEHAHLVGVMSDALDGKYGAPRSAFVIEERLDRFPGLGLPGGARHDSLLEVSGHKLLDQEPALRWKAAAASDTTAAGSTDDEVILCGDDGDDAELPDAIYMQDGRALGAKYEHAKHGMRLEAWWGHVVERQATDWVEGVLLLGADQQVCTAKCLPAMKAAGIVVMRRAT